MRYSRLICSMLQRMLLHVLVVSFVLLAPVAAFGGDTATSSVRLLKFPYPYVAAVTVSSDMDGATVSKFQAVHTLINTQSFIPRNSSTWNTLFRDEAIDKNPLWKDGITGFGLPIADSFQMYDKDFGIYEKFDNDRNEPIPHSAEGKDFRDHFDKWLEQGWIDTLHTPGVTAERPAVQQGLRWLQEKPSRSVRVWTNHVPLGNPSALGWQTKPALMPVLENICRLGTTAIWHLGGRSILNRYIRYPYPLPFPPGYAVVCWTLAGVLMLSFLAIIACLMMSRLRKRKFFLVALGIIAVTIVILASMQMHCTQGDDPSSSYYSADLLKGQFYYYWLASAAPDGSNPVIYNRLDLPEHEMNGRSTIFSINRLQDGTDVLVFRVNAKGRLGSESMGMLTQSGIDDLCEKEGTSILFTHLAYDPGMMFTAKSLDGLTVLRKNWKDGRVWVAPLSEVLHFTFIRTFLQYEAQTHGNRLVINITGLNNSPLKDIVALTPNDLAGMAFECPSDMQVEVQMHGQAVAPQPMEVLNADGRKVVFFPTRSRQTEDHTPTTVP